MTSFYPNPDSKLRLLQRRYRQFSDPDAASNYIVHLERLITSKDDQIGKVERKYQTAFNACQKACDIYDKQPRVPLLVTGVLIQWMRVKELRGVLTVLLGRRYRPQAYEELAVRVDMLIDWLEDYGLVATEHVPSSFTI